MSTNMLSWSQNCTPFMMQGVQTMTTTSLAVGLWFRGFSRGPVTASSTGDSNSIRATITNFMAVTTMSHETICFVYMSLLTFPYSSFRSVRMPCFLPLFIKDWLKACAPASTEPGAVPSSRQGASMSSASFRNQGTGDARSALRIISSILNSTKTPRVQSIMISMKYHVHASPPLPTSPRTPATMRLQTCIHAAPANCFEESKTNRGRLRPLVSTLNL
mmetsp:Transcript_42433/g.95797  ORF Transcript_42433/g.95797 Transcript_42433/m.95797 type:complete len:218 (+) Transcript_42433:196-849(+)